MTTFQFILIVTALELSIAATLFLTVWRLATYLGADNSKVFTWEGKAQG